MVPSPTETLNEKNDDNEDIAFGTVWVYEVRALKQQQRQQRYSCIKI